MFDKGTVALKDVNATTKKSKVYNLGNPVKFTNGASAVALDGTDKPLKLRNLRVKLFVTVDANGTSGTLDVKFLTGTKETSGDITSPKEIFVRKFTQAELKKCVTLVDTIVDHEVESLFQVSVTGGGTLTAGAIFGEVTYID